MVVLTVNEEIASHTNPPISAVRQWLVEFGEGGGGLFNIDSSLGFGFMAVPTWLWFGGINGNVFSHFLCSFAFLEKGRKDEAPNSEQTTNLGAVKGSPSKESQF